MVYSEKRAISSVETGKYESAAQWYQQTQVDTGQDSAVLPAHCPQWYQQPQVDRTLLYSLPTVHVTPTVVSNLPAAFMH